MNEKAGNAIDGRKGRRMRLGKRKFFEWFLQLKKR